MSEKQSILSTASSVTHTHILHYSVILIVIASILGALYYISKHRNRRSKYKVRLLQKKYITHDQKLQTDKKTTINKFLSLFPHQTFSDTAIFTFLLPPSRKCLGLKVGQHLQIEAIIDGKMVARKYTPISKIHRKQTFELLVKIYHKCPQFPEGGAMSQFLDSLQINQQINISLPFGRFNYQKHGQVKIATLDKKTWKKHYHNFFMVAGGTGITPLYQIIQYITQNQLESSPNLTLLFANRTQDDILLLNELKDYAQKNKKINIYFSVDKSVKQGWSGMEGFVDEQKIALSLGNFTNDIQNTLFLSCGPPILSNIVEKIWRNKYHVKAENIFRF